MDEASGVRLSFEAGLERVRASRSLRSGEVSAEVAGLLGGLARRVVEEGLGEAGVRLLREACLQASQVRPSMAEVIRLGSDAAALLGEPQGIHRVVASLGEYASRREALEARLALEAERVLGGAPVRVVTLSWSSACAAVLSRLRASRRLRGVCCVVSGPGGEGRQMARRLVEEGIDVRLFSDAALEEAVREADVALVGADALQTLGWMNKVGTGLLALLALQHSRPLYVAATTLKLLPPTLQRVYATDRGEDHEVMTAAEAQELTRLGASSGGLLQIVNPYRERVDYDLAAGVLTEEGLLSGAAVVERVKRVGSGLGEAPRS